MDETPAVPDEEVPGDDDGGPIAFVGGRGVAYRPGEVIVTARGAGREDEIRRAEGLLEQAFGVTVGERSEADRVGASERFIATEGDLQVIPAIGVLRAHGITAQPNHVLFSDCCCGAGGGWVSNPFSSNPFSSNPFSSNPFSSNPFSSNPFSSNPFSSNPFSSNPAPGGSARGLARGNPALNREPARVLAQSRENLARPSTAALTPAHDPATNGPRVGVLDVPMLAPGSPYRPQFLARVTPHTSSQRAGAGHPDRDGDGFLDKVAGHGMFIAGRIALTCPRASITVVGAFSNQGVADELDVARALEGMVGRYDVVNLSFSAYALEHMTALADAVLAVQLGRLVLPQPGPQGKPAVVVASAGNDATCCAPYPANLPDVVSVAALGPDGPAFFTNYGPWVRACAAGVDVLSAYYDGFQGGMPMGADGDPDAFKGAATWSGTSFAAPLVTGKIAQVMHAQGLTAHEATSRILDAPGLARLPMLGTVVTA